MPRLPTVLLRHETEAGRHFDWLLADPFAPRGRLWAGRVAQPSGDWSADRTFVFHELPSHRRRYLTYQGPISRGRGHVVRVDAGWFEPLLWAGWRRVLRVHLRGCRGLVVLERLGPVRWRARLYPA